MKHTQIQMSNIAQRGGKITKKKRKNRIKALAVQGKPPVTSRIEDAPNMTCPKCLNTGFTGGRIKRTDDECFCTPPDRRPKGISIGKTYDDSPNPFQFDLALALRTFRDLVEQGPVPLILTGEQFVAQPRSRTYWLRINRKREAVAKESAHQEAEIAA
jgi:hypothetical protein